MPRLLCSLVVKPNMRKLSRYATAVRLSTKAGSSRVDEIHSSVFAEFSALAMKYGALNLGQGFPSFPTPDFIKSAAVEAIRSNHNQYTRPGGHPDLVHTLADMYSDLMGRKIDPMSEIMTFTGAQEGIFSIFGALMNEGDEVLIVEPFFDAYINAAKIFKLKSVGIPLEMSTENRQYYNDPESKEILTSSSLQLNMEKLERSITPQTKMLVINTPHNPTGKMFSKTELEQIADIVKRHPQITVLSDEVYEFMCFDGKKHERLASFPGMEDRVISLFSAGKTFSCTGWRTGYAICPSHLFTQILKMHASVSFCVATPFEVALSHGFKEAQSNGYLQELPKLLESKRDKIVNALQKAGMKPIIPEGGYFVCCNSSFLSLFQTLKVATPGNIKSCPDYQMAQLLCEKSGIATIPTSPFYSPSNQHLAAGTIRLAFCKDDNTLENAIRAIASLD